MGTRGLKSICKSTQDALRIRSPKPDLVVVRDAFSLVIEIKIKFSRNLRANANEIDNGLVFQSIAADVPVSLSFPLSLCLSF